MKKQVKRGRRTQLLLFPETELDALKRKRIERILRRELCKEVELNFNRNRVVVVSSKNTPSSVQVRLHQVFLEADHRVIKAIAELIKDKSSSARELLDSFISSHHRRIHPKKKKRVLVLNSKGRVYDLRRLLKEVALEYDLSFRRIKISWSKARIRRGQRSLRLGSYSLKERLIRVNDKLDHPRVPRYFVKFIIFHELLHSAILPVKEKGRINYHPRDFYKIEKRFKNYEQAKRYERLITRTWLR